MPSHETGLLLRYKAEFILYPGDDDHIALAGLSLRLHLMKVFQIQFFKPPDLIALISLACYLSPVKLYVILADQGLDYEDYEIRQTWDGTLNYVLDLIDGE